MHMGNILRYVVHVSFSEDNRNATRGLAKRRRDLKRRINKVERRMAKVDLQKGGEIRGPEPITDRRPL